MSGNLDNYLVLARTASIAGNYQEALDYYNKVLEIEPTHIIGWYGKGEATGWLSTINNLRLNEMLVSFDNAVRFSNNEQEIKSNCAIVINEIVTACYSMCRKHVMEFVALADSWASYLSQCSQIISSYEVAHLYDPNNEVVIRNIISLCEDNIEGISYSDQFDSNTPKAVFLSPNYELDMRSKLQAYSEKLRGLDPSFVPPTPVAAKPDSACFVVTATMGNEGHYIVKELRVFRDKVLSNTIFGRRFISWYYINGPVLAEKIGKHKVMRFLSYLVIVYPSYLMAKLTMFIMKR